jgi:TolB-like protein/tetratricopeptide (TPR) repeat protein
LLFQFDNFRIDSDRRELTGPDGVIHVEPQVFDLLLYFAQNTDRVISKDELVRNIWRGRAISDAALNSRMNSARRAIGDNGKRQALIRTIQRRGFLFSPNVTTRAKEQSSSTNESKEKSPSEPPILTLPDNPSIAVLPFKNLSGDPQQEYFADGIVEDIITGLARIKWLFVIARNSSFTYRGQAVDVRRVGCELGVRYVLEGSVRKAGDRVRISIQLVEAETGIHLWADRCDRKIEDIFAVQDEITLGVVGAIEPSLRDAEIERVKRKRPDNLDAYDLVLRAMPLVYAVNPEELAKAVPLLERATALETDYGMAHGFLAWCHVILLLRAGLKEGNRIAAIRHARAAVAHGRDDPTALSLGAFVIGIVQHDRVVAVEAFERALALSPSSAFALSMGSVVHAHAGKAKRAIEWAERAVRLSPIDMLAFTPYNALAMGNFQLGHYEEAANAARRAVRSNPTNSSTHRFLAAALAKLGELEAAEAAAMRASALEPAFSARAYFAACGTVPELAEPLADAWRRAGLPI